MKKTNDISEILNDLGFSRQEQIIFNQSLKTIKEAQNSTPENEAEKPEVAIKKSIRELIENEI